MSVQGIQAGKAFVEFLIKDDKLDSGLLKVAGKLRKFGSIGLAATAPLIAGFTAAVATFTRVGGALDDMHRRTGLSVESLSELSFAAQQTGTDMGVVEKAVKELQKNGIDPLKFDEIANDIASLPTHVQRAQRAIDVFGAKAGVALLPMLEDLPKLREEARRLGLVMSTEDAQAADALGDAWDASKAQLVALTAQIGASLAGPLTTFLTWTQSIVADTIAWVHNNPRLVRTIAAVTLGIAGAALALLAFGAILTFITLHPIVAVLTVIAGLITGIATYFGLAGDGVKKFKQDFDSLKSSVGTQIASAREQAISLQSQFRGVSLGTALQEPITPTFVATANRMSATSGDTDWLRKIEFNTAATNRLLALIRPMKWAP